MSFPFLKDILYHLLGVEVPLTQFIPTFGLFVALSLILGIYVFILELKRLEKEGGVQLPHGASEFAQNLCMAGIVAGFVGAKVFYILEYPGDFIKDPFGMIFSRGGWTIYGGIFFGFGFAIYYLRKRNLPVWKLFDTASPMFFMSYALGRVGCHLSGDGDWGIPANLALKPQWFPDWLWSSYYTNNVLGLQLEAPVYPTPIYEFLACGLLFLLLWLLRRHRFQPGWLFSLYLLFSGVERFLIEKIRVNVRYDFGFISATQAEIVSTLLILAGLFGVFKFMKRGTPVEAMGVGPSKKPQKTGKNQDSGKKSSESDSQKKKKSSRNNSQKKKRKKKNRKRN